MCSSGVVGEYINYKFFVVVRKLCGGMGGEEKIILTLI
jgi:hypothetical protein